MSKVIPRPLCFASLIESDFIPGGASSVNEAKGCGAIAVNILNNQKAAPRDHSALPNLPSDVRLLLPAWNLSALCIYSGSGKPESSTVRWPHPLRPPTPQGCPSLLLSVLFCSLTQVCVYKYI